MKIKSLAVCAASALMMALLSGCGQTSAPGTAESGDAAAAAEIDGAVVGENAFIITLYPDVAPITCENFEGLVKNGFYDGLTFHRVIDDFMAQGGDPKGDGTGGSDKEIKGEFSSNGVENNLSHQRGVISMARSMDMNSASSQFFICYADCTFLDGQYAAFGEVKEGMEVVDSFLKVERTMGGDGAPSAPVEPIVMEKVAMISDDAEGHPRVEVKMAPIPVSEQAEEAPAEEAPAEDAPAEEAPAEIPTGD
ncbi:MAG: peptidylprolyl isomerase [Oscillospiraceae bacterium]|nr:peptidylprolyl isomerase [Oscillospiraceae bacterium]